MIEINNFEITQDLIAKGEKALHQEKWEKAHDYFEEAFNLEPDSWLTILAFAKCQLRCWRFDDAKKRLLQLCELKLRSKQVDNILNEFGSIILTHMRIKKWEAVEQCFEVIYSFVSKHKPRCNILFLSSLKACHESKEDDAIEIIENIFSDFQLKASQIDEWTNEFRYHHYFSLAEYLIRTSLYFHPNESRLFLQLGSIVAEQNRIKEATNYWKKSKNEQADAHFLFSTSSYTDLDVITPDPQNSILDYSRTNPNEIVGCINNCGFVIIKNNPRACFFSELKLRLQNNLEKCYFSFFPQKKLEKEIGVPIEFLASAKEQKKLYQVIEKISSQPQNTWYQNLNKNINLDDLFIDIDESELISKSISLYFARGFKRIGNMGYARMMSAAREKVLPLHQDARTGYWWMGSVIAAWIPLTECGEHAPSIQLVPWRFNSLFPVHLYSDTETKKRKYFQYHSSVNDLLVPEKLIFTPRLDPGDIVLFDSLTLHGTQPMTECNGERYNMDFRYGSI